MNSSENPPSAGQHGGGPMFSIVTVCRNAAATVATTARSILEQSCKDWEWIVVDGASTDGTVDEIRKLLPQKLPVRIVSEPDSGIYEAMNKGVRLARGAYLHFLNADDSYHDAAVLEDVSRCLRENAAVDFLYGNIAVIPPGGVESFYKPPALDKALEEMVCGCLPHQGSFFRARLFSHDVGLFNESLRTAGDYDWMLRAVAHPGVKLHYLNRAMARFASDGASSRLEKSLPESFDVLNAATAFQQVLGTTNLIRCYQQQVLALRMQLQSASLEIARVSAERDKLKGKHAESKSRLEKSRQKSGARPDSPLKAWLRKLLRL